MSGTRDKIKLLSSERVVNNVEQYVLTKNIDLTTKTFDKLENEENDFKYYCFRQVNGDSTRLVNKLRGIDDLAVFYDIKTSTLSSLQPKIRIFKVNHADFDKDASGRIEFGSVKALPTPCYREFKFSDNFGIETAASVQEYLKYESTKPNFRNVGLESFMVTQNGENHGAIENNIECKLSLTFKSLKDINASPPDEPSLRYVDLILWPPARFTKDTEKANPSHYEIKVVLGYTAPSEAQLKALNLTRREEQALRNIEKLDQIISLGLYDYQIDIQENGSVKLTASYRGRLETVMGTNQVNVFQDTIRIGESGKFELVDSGDAKFNMSNFYDTASNIKSINSGLKKSDCLQDCQEKLNLISMIKKDIFFCSVLRKVVEANSAIRYSHLGLKSAAAGSKTFQLINNDPQTEKKLYDWFKNDSNVEIVLNSLKDQAGFFKEQIFKSFIEGLLNGNRQPRNTTETNFRPRMFLAEVGGKNITVEVFSESETSDGEVAGAGTQGEGFSTPDGATLGKADLQRKLNALTTAVATERLSFQFKRAQLNENSAKNLSEQATKQLKASTGHAQESAPPGDSPDEPDVEDEEVIPKYSAPAYIVDETFTNMRFYYLYLGDIIELACKNARVPAMNFGDFDHQHDRASDQYPKPLTIYPKTGYFEESALSKAANYQLNHARVLLGPLEYVDDDGVTQKINLAKMPISYNYFKSWFINKIIRRRRSQMPLGVFLVSLLNDLVVPSLGVGMSDSRKPPGTKANIISLTLPGKINLEKPKVKGCGGGEISFYEEALPEERSINTEGAVFMNSYFKETVKPRSTISAVKSSFDYMLLFISSHKDIIERRGDPAEDVSEGIYHFNIGSDRGLLRNMSFSRVSIPYMAAYRSELAEEQGVDQLEQLKFPYNTDVNLVGTSLFVPGMFYYINPSLAGLGSVENAASLAYQMNLGGYHLVQKVSTNISAGRFITQIEGTQTAQGRR